MDDIDDFFDFSKPFERVTVPGGYIDGKALTARGSFQDRTIVKREDIGSEYARSVVEEENKKLVESMKHACSEEAGSSFDQMETFDDSDDDVDETEGKHLKTDDIFDRYNFNIRSDIDLPIHDNQTKITKAIRDSRVLVLEGDTGCGKTTQVPQFILDDAYNRREYVNIICTQPRRIAAISIAQRVCAERKWQLGTVVGYQVGLHTVSSEDTRLLYCTTGVLLQKLIKSKDMKQYTHVILDEVHERDQDMDFLLIVIRRLLLTNSKHVKVILMSATIDTTLFADYFKLGIKPAPIIKCDNRRLYTVKDFYLCELERLKFEIDINYDEPGISEELYKVALKLIIICEKIESSDNTTEILGHKASILIFLPGINEIEKMEKSLEKLHKIGDIKFTVIRLHSLISPDEQQRVFERPTGSFRKIILSTNIAESSITVPDVKFVIDFCLTKYLVTDSNTNFTSLQLQWASRSNCKQRAGRAGRLMNGRVYRMVPKQFYNELLSEFGTPEMERCPLENVVLKSKLLDMGPPHSILGLALSPPKFSDIRNTLLILKELGALFKTVSGKYEDYDGDLSYVGRVMSALPLDVRISKLIIFGYMFGILDECIVIAAGLSVKSIFTYPYNNTIGAYIQKLVWADGSGSDLFAILKAYRVWCSMKEHRNMTDGEKEDTWARRYFINTRAMREMHLLVIELTERLKRLQIKTDSVLAAGVNWLDREKTIILKVCIAGAFYPNYFLRSNANSTDGERDIYHIMCGNDPCKTVYFNRFDQKHIGQLYTKSIKNLFSIARLPAHNIDVKFEPGTEKVFCTFKTDVEEEYGGVANKLLVPGHVRFDVMKALKMRQAKVPTTINVMRPREGLAYAEERGLGNMIEGRWVPTKKSLKYPECVVIPSVYTKNIRGVISHIENCSKFWFQPLSEVERLRDYSERLNGNEEYTSEFRNPSLVSKGMTLAAPFQGQYHRARVLQVIQEKSSLQFRVLFIDYGNAEIVDFDKLRQIHMVDIKDMPPRVFQCKLAELQPSSFKCPSGLWPEEAMEFMQEAADRGTLELEIYSVVKGVASVYVKLGDKTLNHDLIENGWAQKCDEDFMSKSDHDLRFRRQASRHALEEEDHSHANEEYLESLQTEVSMEVDPPEQKLCTMTMDLRGPFSPLETKVYPAVRIGYWKTVHIEKESVNSVLLDTDPHDNTERLLVATSVTEANNSSLTSRQTTLMPNIGGFGALMAMVFCPTLQIKRNKEKTKYISVLTGLGHSDTYQPLFEEHDMVFHFDVEIVATDLELINQIRYCMDTLVLTRPEDEMPSIAANARYDIIAQLKNLFIKLLEKPRPLMQIERSNDDCQWVRPDIQDLMQTKHAYGPRSLYPFHSGLRLYNESFENIRSLTSHCTELHSYRKMDHMLRPMNCMLCNTHLENITQLRIHILSQLHRDRESQIKFVPQE